MQHMASDNKVRLHLPDGPAQEARDAELASGTTDIFFSAWEWLYRHNPEAAVDLSDSQRAIALRI